MFEKDWCSDLYLLKYVSVHPKNKNFKSIIENRILLGKSNPKRDIFDSLLFVCREDYQSLTIPSSVKIIESSAMYGCCIEKVEFLDDSRLEIIENDAFNSSSIVSIEIPSHVRIIENRAFKETSSLKTITFGEDSKLEAISNQAFSESVIETITIPPHVKAVCKLAFEECDCLKSIKFKVILIYRE